MRKKSVMTKLLGLILVFSMIMPFALPMTSVSAVSAYDLIYARNFDEAASVNGQGKAWEKYTDRIGSFWDPGYMVFREIDFGSVSPSAVAATAGARANASKATAVEFRIDAPDGPLIASVPFEVKDFRDPSTGIAAVKVAVTGVHDVYVKPDTQTINFYNFQFYAPEAPRLSYTSYSEGGIYEGIEDVGLARDVDLIWQIGMLFGEAGDEFEKDMPVSRAEFAKSIYGIYTDIRAAEEAAKDPLAKPKGPIDTGFYDVAGDSEYAEAIAYLSQNGIMNGVGDGLFQPDYFIEKLDAITVLIRAIGYKNMAEAEGGYPNGYIKLATKQGLISNSFNGSDLLTYEALVELLVNGLDVDFLTPEIITGEYIKYTSIGSVLADTQNLKKGEGKVSATVATTLALPASGLKQSEVLINGTKYEVGTTNAVALIGAECDYYYVDGEDTKTLRAIVPSSTTEITYISSMDDDVRAISNDKIAYTPAGEEEEEEIEIRNDAAILYNGVSIEKKLSEVMDYPTSFTGFITVIENGIDETQTISIEEYQDVIIESVDADQTGVVAYKTTDVSKRNHIDWDDSAVFVLEDMFGESLKLSELKAGDLYTIYESKNETGKKFLRMYKGQSEFVGTVDKIEDGKLYINGTEYQISNAGIAPEIGQESKFLLNMYGLIVKAEKADTDTWKIGLYIGRTNQNDGFENTIEIKLVKTDGKVEIFTLNDSVTIDNIRQTDYDTICGKLDSITKKVTSTGAPYTNDISAILYRQNAEGKIAGIDIAAPAGSDTEYGNSLLELWKHPDGAYVDGDTRVVRWNRTLFTLTDWTDKTAKWLLPATSQAFAFYGDDRENGCDAGTAKDVMKSGSANYWGSLYSTQGDTNVGDLFIWNRNNLLGYEDDPQLVVKSIATSIDEEGNEIKILKGWVFGEEKEYKVDMTNVQWWSENDNAKFMRASLNYVKPGDILQLRAYNKGAYSGYINRVQAIRCLESGADKLEGVTVDGVTKALNVTRSKTNGNTPSEVVTGAKTVLGKVLERGDSYLIMQHGDSTKQLVNIGGPVCVVDKRDIDGEVIVSNGTTDNIEVGDWVFAYIVDSAMNATVIYKHWN